VYPWEVYQNTLFLPADEDVINASIREDGVRKTQYGLVKRLSKPFPEQVQGQTIM